MGRPAGLLVAFGTIACCCVPLLASAAQQTGPPATAARQKAQPDAATAALVAEVRQTFKLHGKPIPPEIFRDFGDGDLADSSDIWVTVNVDAAIGSNLYYDDIKEDGDWVFQTKTVQKPADRQETAYKFVGSTENGMLAVIATFNGGGSGYFTILHVLDLTASRAFDLNGNLYWQINLTNVRNFPLGDRWEGKISIANNSIRIVTTRDGPADMEGKGRPPVTIEAERP